MCLALSSSVHGSTSSGREGSTCTDLPAVNMRCLLLMQGAWQMLPSRLHHRYDIPLFSVGCSLRVW